MRTTRRIDQAPGVLARVAAKPLVAGLAADAEARAELGHAEDLALVVGDEA